MAIPPCPYFGVCGGCTAQHIDYAVQLENKRKALTRAIAYEDTIAVFDAPYGYRTRMDFLFHPKGVGLRKKEGARHVMDVERCAIASVAVNALLAEVRASFFDVDAYDRSKRGGTFCYAVIRGVAPHTSVSFVLNKDSPRIADAVERIKAFAKTTSSENVIVTYTDRTRDESTSDEHLAVKGADTLEETYGGKRFAYSAQGFFQNNHVMAEKMHVHVQGILRRYRTEKAHLLDLYAGVGTFGINSAGRFKDVLIVESFGPAAELAKQNIKTNGAANARVMALDAKHLGRIDLTSPLVVITDPPRSGMDRKTIECLQAKKPQIIIYISCNVGQLAKDIKKFKGYSITSAALFDLFPQTPHSEAVVELVRRP